jgi:hypothetical protein
MAWGTVELEPEIKDWLEGLPTTQFAHVAFYVELLAEHGPLLGEPYTKQLDGRLRELRFYLERDAMRVTYWMRERRQVARARRVLARCISEEHTADEEEVQP